MLDYVRVQFSLLSSLRHVDVLYVRAHFMSFPVSLCGKLLRIPVFQEVNGRPDDLAVTYPRLAAALMILRWLYRIQLSWADHVIAVTDGLASWARAEGGHARVTTVANGANTKLFIRRGKRLGCGSPMSFSWEVLSPGTDWKPCWLRRSRSTGLQG